MRPGREFVENIAEIGEGIDVMQFAGLDHGNDGPTDSPFHRIVVDGQRPVLTVPHQGRPSIQGIRKGFGDVAFGGDPCPHLLKPRMEGRLQFI